MEIEVVLTSHRVEYIPMIRDSAMASEVIMLEEPPNDNLFRFFNGEMDLRSYVKSLDTSFPVYTYFLSDLLKHMNSMGKRILQIEPYLEIVQKMQKSIEDGTFEEFVKDKTIESVRNIEKKVFGAFIKYQEVFMSKDFDELVDATVNFSVADAERFRFRDEMRLSKIFEVIEHLREKDENMKIMIESGSIHTRIPERLNKELKEDYIKTVDLKRIAAKMLGIEYLKNPGTQLTEIFINDVDAGEEELKLLAARSLVYISKVSPQEMLPKSKNDFPHLVEEMEISKKVSSMDYDECKQEFMKIWNIA
ncbi:hypothetical protein Asulf_00883 [Archaeoglobus sulfaticallidus PM70-1]|uniref:Uncharacterized protein n=1 Tax=Archaeoglobus sulfaticallidus PM70-1 TaxID=387631 RepID=N0BL03_9EURY|nr:hypothetical protein [Archaeoglobus sulfaticallidus]AGK60890.1 hypothetical protein Asulf_00883 [Archaeoglobus sulfaticallidus PM70-1]